MTRLLRRGGLPTACGVGSINQLFGVIAALRDSGVPVPAEMSIVSFDEDECLAFLDVPVTSVAMPLVELGAAAVGALIARIEHRPAGDVMIREPMSLLLRQSVAAPPRPRSNSARSLKPTGSWTPDKPAASSPSKPHTVQSTHG
jgi:LacI family transcriptional regulator